MLASEYLKIEHGRFEAIGVFDPIIDGDAAFFINIQRLKQTKVPQFIGSYNRIRQYFIDIATLLSFANLDNKSDKFFREAYRRFDFGEVNGINLGFSNSLYGSGMGPKIRMKTLKDAFSIVRKGCTAPEIFELIGLFEEGVAADRISDMIASIIKTDIEEYTKTVMTQLEINKSNYKQLRFDSKGIAINPIKKNCQLLFVPMDILFDLPVSRCWEDISIVSSQNEVIREEMNDEVKSCWQDWNAKRKSEFIKSLFENPTTSEKMINRYRLEKLGPYNIYNDSSYFYESNFPVIKNLIDNSSNSFIDSKTGALEAIRVFKDWVENNKGWNEIRRVESKYREKSVQCFLHACTKYFMDSKNLDFSAEPNEGRGPVDFKVSRGIDKTVIELKLSSNDKYLKGYCEQIRDYASSEATDKMVFVYVDLGDFPKRTERLIKQHEDDRMERSAIPELVIVNSKPQKSASV